MPYARTTDPPTSHEAARSIVEVTETQRFILELLRDMPLADHELVNSYQRLMDLKLCPSASESGIRSRRAELVDRGLVFDSGLRSKTPSGRSCIVWSAITSTGKLLVS